MKSAAQLTISAFGVIAAIAGFEHGFGEILQGNRMPDGILILSWPDSPFFQIHSGEPAMTLIPNLLTSGILTVLVSLAFLLFVTTQIHKKLAGLIVILLSILWLLVGGGFGPPILGIILGIATFRQQTSERGGIHKVGAVRRFLGTAWPVLLAAGLIAWLMVFPGLNLLDYALQANVPDAVVYTVIASAFAFLFLSIWAGAVRDTIHRTETGYAKPQSG